MLIMKITNLIPLVCLALMVTSCTKDTSLDNVEIDETTYEINYDEATDVEEFPNNLRSQSNDELETRNTYNSYFTFNTLNKALKYTGLDRAVFSGRKTVYAPSDAAFRTLGYDERSICNVNKTTLRSILLYHVVEGRISDNKNGCLEMIDGNNVHLKDGECGKEVNESLVYTSFTLSGSGYNVRLNAINQVLSAPTENIVGAAAGTEMFSSLVAAVLAADPAIATALSNPDANLTVFAPTNEAFQNLIDALGVGDLNGLVAALGVDNLTQVLLYHVVDGCVFSNELQNGQTITTLLGETITTEFKRNRRPRIEDAKGGKSVLVTSALDIRTSNGVVHTIDRVLLPSII